jgi:hypothetical protein
MNNMSILGLWNTLSRKKGGDQKEKKFTWCILGNRELNNM